MAEGRVLCVDIGSTYTKAALVDTADGRLLGTTAVPTTLASDVLDGVAACAADLGASGVPVRACSSAGGGLRIAVLGNERLVTGEAGRRVALSSGGKVVHVAALADDADPLPALRAAEPDLVLLVGGTDGGNAEPALRGARLLAGTGLPVVYAGSADVRDDALAELGPDAVGAANVVPRIGVIAPDGARGAIREAFLAHVIGGKHLSRGDLSIVRGPTPDLVLTGVEVLAAGTGLDVVVVDVGGATTDVHSVVALDPEDASLGREVVATTPVTRTVEGDLGMRWSALSTAEAGVEAGLAEASLVAAVSSYAADPARVPDGPAEQAVDRALATTAVLLAVRRHAGRSRVVVGPDGRVVERTGKDLREIDLLVGSGGVLRHAAPEVAESVLGRATGEDPEGWQVPRAPRLVVDADYVLAAVGLLAADHPSAALALARRHLAER